MGNVQCSKPGCCCRLLQRPPPPSICGGRCYGCTKCCMLPPEREILLLGRSNAGKTHILYRFLGSTFPHPDPTKGFSNQLFYHENNTRCYEFYDVSGAEAERPFWRTLYTNVKFDDVIYVLDPLEYRANKDKLAEDRLELHTLLAEPELAGAQFILYFNWKKLGIADAKEAELKAEDKIRTELDMIQDLELTGFRNYVDEVLDPLKSDSIDLEGDTARKEREEELRNSQLDAMRREAEKKRQAKEAKEAKDAKKERDELLQQNKQDEKKQKKELGKPKKLMALPRAMVVTIASEDQLFTNLDMRVNLKTDVKDADEELYDVL